ncbi:MAG: helical backbone metal receptor [Bacteroidota bacterium]
MREFTDQMGRLVSIPAFPQRIISLCPSLTESLFDLGMGDRVVGRTRFCIHPASQVRPVVRVGGTKDIVYDRVDALKPDLILAEKEENTPEMVERLASQYPVWVADVVDLPSAYQMIDSLGRIGGVKDSAELCVTQIKQGFDALTASFPPLSVLYFIWRNPWMVVGEGTYIHDVLTHLGLRNLGADLSGRYPHISEAEIQEMKPDLIWLSSEPYPFKSEHLAELGTFTPQIQLVDGEKFSWYGTHMQKAIPYFHKVRQELNPF